MSLRNIAMAVEMFRAEYVTYPKHLAYVAPNGSGGASYLGTTSDLSRVLKDPRLNTPPYEYAPGADIETRMAEIDAHCDFYYAGAGVEIRRVRNPSSFILLYDHAGAGRKRIVVFADGHVESIPASTPLDRIVDETNRDRAAQKLPPLPRDLSGPPATAGPSTAGSRVTPEK